MVTERLGRYVLRHEIARGGMATVHLAQVGGSAKWVAVKLIHPHLAEDRRFAAMFMDEARIAARIEHPNVCQVLDFGEERGRLYLVLEYLHGEPLSAVMQRQPPIWLAARVAADIARGLHAAHELAGRDGRPLELVHRDVSPQNIVVLYEGISKLTDFGVARAEGRLAETRTGEVKGKIRYMAPEQLAGRSVDRRADVWSLGVILWEATCGRQLFSGAGEGEVVMRVMNDAIARPASLRPDYPPSLEQTVMRALERDASRRFASAAELAAALDDFLASIDHPSSAGPVSRFMSTAFAAERARREALLHPRTAPDRRRTFALPAALTAIGLTTGTLIGLYLPPGHSRDSPSSNREPAPGHSRDSPLSNREAQPGYSRDSPSSNRGEDAGGAVVTMEEPVREVRRPRRRRASVSAAAAPGTLNLLAVPAAEVRWRGRPLGTTPLLDVELPAGSHTLTLRSLRGDLTKTVRVRIRPGELTRRSVSLD